VISHILDASRKWARALAAAPALALLVAGVLATTAPASAADRPKLAVLDTVLIDYMTTSTGEPVSTPEEEARVKALADVLRKRMAEIGTYDVLPKPSGGKASEEVVDLSCPSCVLDMARAQGADFVLTSAVMRVSNIILYLKLELDNVATAKAVKVGDVQFKGFDEEQLRGAALYAVNEVFGPSENSAKDGSPESPDTGR